MYDSVFPSALRRPAGSVLVLLAALSLFAHLGIARADEMLVVNLDQAKVLQLPEKTSTIVIGNPGVADVTFIKRSGNLILTGKSYGQTNMIALDANGKALAEMQVRVAAGPGAVVVQLGDKRVSYSCSPRCQPTLALGDDTTFSGQVTSQAQARNGFAAPNAR